MKSDVRSIKMVPLWAKKLWLGAAMLAAWLMPGGGLRAGTVDEMAGGFMDPGNSARPRAYWNWLNGAVSLPGLTRDLEEAKAKGMGGLEIWDCEAMRNPDGFVPSGPPFMGPESVAAMRHSIKEAKRLGLDLGLVTSSGWNAGGPWVAPEMASKNLFVATTTVAGPGQISNKLPFPKVPDNCPMGDDGHPQWWHDVAVLAWPVSADKMIPDAARIINLIGQTKDGELHWEVPEGEWQVARFVCSNNGQQLIAASPNSKGPFIDFLDPEATRFHFEHIIHGLGLQKGSDPGPFKYLEVDSMEMYPGIQWTPGFPDWFHKHFGYDVIPWLPVLAGWTVADVETSTRFRYDYQKAVSDLLIFSHYITGSAVCAEYGLQLVGEAGGPGPPIWETCPVDALKALGNVHVPRGEFWVKSPRNIFLIKEIASAAHIYGKPIVDAEAWTTWRRWSDGPFTRKLSVDRAFCEGLNRITYHGFAHSPAEAGLPGRAYHAGVEMNPQELWWSKARPFMDYLSRCSHLLQQGSFVADVAYYYGDQAPNFWPLHHDLPEKPMMPGLGIGYDYDVVNTDVILNRMSVRDGRIVLPDGMSYRVLVLPERPDMPLEVLVKLEKLVADGATILGPKPTVVPGLHDKAAWTEELQRLADEMWGTGQQAKHGAGRHGQGRVVWGISSRDWLALDGLGPDFSFDSNNSVAQLDYIHRRTPDADIYFVRNPSLEPVAGDCEFRVQGRWPQIWNPDDGTSETVLAFDATVTGTRLRLDLPAGGSTFVVFIDAPSPARAESLVCKAGAPDGTLPVSRLVALGADSATIRCWSNGSYELVDGLGHQRRMDANGVPEPAIFSGPWEVAFDPTWGAPAKVVFPELISWTGHSEEGIKHYSGTGAYTRTLEIPADRLGAGNRVYLDLGQVREVAEVFVNGRSAGILWKPPFRADITGLVKPGANALRIEVMNLWINRLMGDQNLPDNKKFTRTNIRRGQEWEAQPAGLLGPVRLLSSRDFTVKW